MRLIDSDKIKQSVTIEMLKAELNSPIYCTLECVISDVLIAVIGQTEMENVNCGRTLMGKHTLETVKFYEWRI